MFMKTVFPRIASTLRRLMLVLMLGCTSAAAVAQDGGSPPEVPPESRSDARGLPFGAFLNEYEMRLVFDFLRDAFIAHMRNEEPPGLPPELLFKMEVMKQRMLREGDLAVRMMLFALQRELERARLEMDKRARERDAAPRDKAPRREIPPPSLPPIPPGERTRT